MSYHNLTNEEIIFLYFVGTSVVTQYEEAFDDNSLTQSIATDLGVMEVKTEISKELLEEMLKSKHYVMMKEIVNKLHPIYILIKEAQPEMVSEMDDIFNYKPKK
jgi:hypothetical protein